MASHRILTMYFTNRLTLTALGLLLVATLILNGCGTTREVQESGPVVNVPEKEEVVIDEALVSLLDDTRSELSDVYYTQESDIPPLFLEDAVSRNIGNPNQGYRIQIISTRNISRADSIANDFRFWADDTFKNYFPKPYVIYQQPFYKVHVGNFQFYERATQMTKLLKKRYPGAWVVHDKVDPKLTPPDSVNFIPSSNEN